MKYLSLVIIFVVLMSCKKDDAGPKPAGSGYSVVLSWSGWNNTKHFPSTKVDSFSSVVVNSVSKHYPVDSVYTLNSGDKIHITIDTALFGQNNFIEFQLTVTNPSTLSTDTSFYVFDYIKPTFRWRIPTSTDPNGFYTDYFGNTMSITIP